MKALVRKLKKETSDEMYISYYFNHFVCYGRQLHHH